MQKILVSLREWVAGALWEVSAWVAAENMISNIIFVYIFIYTMLLYLERHFGNLGEFYASKSQEEWGCFEIPTASSHAAVFHLLKPSLSIPNSFFIWEI